MIICLRHYLVLRCPLALGSRWVLALCGLALCQMTLRWSLVLGPMALCSSSAL